MIRPDHAPVHSSPGTLSQAGFLDLNVRADMFKQNLVTQVEQDLQQEHPQDQPQQEEAYNLQLPEKEAGRFEGSVSGVDAARRMLCRPNAEKIVDQQVSSGAQDKGKGSSVAFHLLLPVLLTDLDRDKGMQLQCIWEKLKRNKINKMDFVTKVRSIVGDQMLKEATKKVHPEIRNALAQTNNQANPSQHSLFSQVSTQQIPSTRVSAWPTDQQTSSRGRMNARPPLTLVNPALTQAKKRARTAADDSDARPEATLPVPGLGKGIQEVGLVVSKMDLTSSAKATVGASATGARACQLGGQQPRLPNWSEMLDRGFSTNHLPDPASDKTKAFMHASFGCIASLKMLYDCYTELSEAQASSSTNEVKQLRHELAAEKKNTMRLKIEKDEKAEAYLVEVTKLKRDFATLAASNDRLNIILRSAQEEASAARTSTTALHSKLAEVFKSLNASMEKLGMKVDPPLVQTSEGYAHSLLLLAEKLHEFASGSTK